MMRIREDAIPAVLIAATVVLVLAATASAQVRQKEAMENAMTGKVVGVDTTKRTLSLAGANEEVGTFGVDEKATILSGSEKIGLEDLKEGQYVVIDIDERGDTNVATYIEVVDAPDVASPPNP